MSLKISQTNSLKHYISSQQTFSGKQFNLMMTDCFSQYLYHFLVSNFKWIVIDKIHKNYNNFSLVYILPTVTDNWNQFLYFYQTDIERQTPGQGWVCRVQAEYHTCMRYVNQNSSSVLSVIILSGSSGLCSHQD